ncbi:MAG TPA: dTDP-4-dehydrorhamnose reductase [Wenzhouxiangella sp.]|nr:dTDP-4-dehydrorhamnose reductase [Wenzhouxiangella sp.]
MKILLTGAEGQLGRHLAPCLATVGGVVTTSRRGGDLACDLSDERALADLLSQVEPTVIVNPAAWTAVDAAEENPEAVDRLNRWLPDKLAAWARDHDALLIHYSTDYVFSGQSERPWSESDQPNPVSEYGRSKWAGEKAVQDSGARAIILRTAWLYSACPGNFLSAILRKAQRGEALRVVSDQVGSPTWAGSLAQATADLLLADEHRNGLRLLHASDRGCMSWHDFASLAVSHAAELGLIDGPVSVEAIDSSQWPQLAVRPSWSVLDPSALEAACNRPQATVERSLATCLQQWKESPC